jgi:hypothetical protein
MLMNLQILEAIRTMIIYVEGLTWIGKTLGVYEGNFLLMSVII